MKKTILLFLLPLAAAAAELPLFTVPAATKGLFKVDGVLSDHEWGNTVRLTNFMRIGDNRFAAEQTEVMVCSSGKMLYFGFRLHEYALEKLSNQYKMFKADLKGKNKPVWNDDCMELRIAPPWIRDQRFFYIGIGAGGATKVIVPKGFKGSNVEDKLQLAVKQYNGFWCAELAVPFEALGAKAEGDWKINFVRFEKRLSENSSYCPLLPGEHGNLGKHAVMRFSSVPLFSRPQVREGDYSKLTALKDLPVTLTGTPWKGKWQSRCGGKTETGTALAPGKNIITMAPFDSAYGTAALKIGDFYRSPAYPLSKSSSKINLDSPALLRGSFNGKAFQGKNTVIYPSEGINTLTFSLAAGKSAELKTDTELGLPVKWDFPADSGKVLSSAKGVKFVNTSKSEVKFSAKFFHNSSKFLPPGVDRQTLHVTENGTYVFLWDILGTTAWDFTKALEKAELHLYLPDSVELLGVDNRVKYPRGFKKLNWPVDKQFYKAEKLERKKVLGVSLQHWVIKRTAPAVFSYQKSLRHHQFKRDRACIFLRGKKGYTGPRESFAFYHMKAFGGKLGETVKLIPVRLHPELKGAQVPDLTMSLMNYWCDDLQNTHLTEHFYNTLLAAGVNEVVMDSRFAPPQTLRYLARVELERINWRNTYPDLEEFIRKHPESRIVNYKGYREDVVSISHLLEHPELHHKFFMVLVKLKQDHPGIDGLFMDLEEDPFRSRYGGDYSEASLSRFSREHKIREKLTPEIIISRYADKWISFRGSEIGKISRLLRTMCRRLGWDFTFYTDYDSPKAIRMYTADWQYLNGAIDRAYMGYGRDPRQIESTRKKLPGTPLVFGLLTWTNTANYETALQLRRIIDSKQGVLMWFARGFGAKEAMALADATRFYDAFRAFFLAGKRTDKKFPVPGLVPDEIAAFELEGKTMLLLLNNSFQVRKVRLDLLDLDRKDLREFFSGKVFKAGEKIEIEIPPRGAAAFSGKLKLSASALPSGSGLILNGSFEERSPGSNTPLHWRSTRNSFAAVCSSERTTAGKCAALLQSDGSKNAVMIQHIDLKKAAGFSKIWIELDFFVDHIQTGMILPMQLIVVTKEKGKRKSNYPGARIFSKTGDGMGSWVRVSKDYDLTKYKNITAIELWITGWDYGKKPFKGKFFVDNVRIKGIR